MLPHGLKISVLDRDEEAYKGGNGAPGRYSRNYDERLQPLAKARELQRAVTAAKMKKMFSKPFVAALDCHRDTPLAMRTSHDNAHDLFSSAADGSIVQWNLYSKSVVRHWSGHSGWATDLATSPCDRFLFSVGHDKRVRQWLINENNDIENQYDDLDRADATRSSTTLAKPEAKSTYKIDGAGLSLDVQWSASTFCVAADTMQVFDLTRKDPVHSFDLGASDGFLSARFCPTDPNIIMATSGNRALMLIDLRAQSEARKLTFRTNMPCVAWNPQNPQMAAVGSEDSNIYQYDVRYMEKPNKVRKGHMRAVNCISFSPCGRSFVSGSDDNTIRIFPTFGLPSKDCYHGKRMQKVQSVEFARDGRYVFSGSSDFTVRMWKAEANFKASAVSHEEKTAIRYRETLIKKHKHMPEMKAVMKMHKLPKFVKTMRQLSKIKDDSTKRKQSNLSTRKSFKPIDEKRDIIKECD